MVIIGSLAHGGYSKNGESGTHRLIRTLCKAVQIRGCEKSGRMVDFDLSLEEDGITGNPLAQFKGNRFNIIFYNAGIVYYLQKNCKIFFNDVFEENRLLTAAHYDLNVTSFIPGCRALGLIDKFLTGPLWRLLVQVKNVLDLRSCLFLSGRKFVLGKSKKHKNTINFTNISYLDPKLGLHMDFIVLLRTALLIFSLLEQFLSNESFSFFSLKILLKSSYHTPCIIT